MSWFFLPGIADAIRYAWGAAPTPSEPAPIPDVPVPGKWDYDLDVLATVCDLQAEWLRLRGSGDPARWRVMRRYHKAISDLYPNAA